MHHRQHILILAERGHLLQWYFRCSPDNLQFCKQILIALDVFVSIRFVLVFKHNARQHKRFLMGGTLAELDASSTVSTSILTICES